MIPTHPGWTLGPPPVSGEWLTMLRAPSGRWTEAMCATWLVGGEGGWFREGHQAPADRPRGDTHTTALFAFNAQNIAHRAIAPNATLERLLSEARADGERRGIERAAAECRRVPDGSVLAAADRIAALKVEGGDHGR